MSLKIRLSFSRFMKVLHKLGMVAAILSFTFDGQENRVKRSRRLECYSFLLISGRIIFTVIMYVRFSLTFTDVVLGVVTFLQMIFIFLNWSVLLMCLTSNRQRIVELVNDGLKIERDFRIKYYPTSWNFYLIFVIYFKDIFYVAGRIYYLVSENGNNGFFLYYLRIVSIIIFSFTLAFVENFKIIAHYHVSHLLGVLNKLLSRKRCNINIESIREISKMYERLLIFTENISKLLKFRTATVLISSLIITSTEV
jgi:hypothetical protein